MQEDVYRSLRWMASARAVAQIVSWASTVVVIRLLSPEDYGLVAMATLFSGYLLFLGDFGLGTAIISRRETDPGVLRAAYGASLTGGAILFLVMLVVAPAIAAFFGNTRLTSLIQVSGLLFLAIGASTVPRALLAMRMRFREISIAGMVSSLATTATTLSLAWAGYGPWALVIGSVVGGMSKALQLQWYAGRPPRPTLALAPIRGLLRLSGYLIANMTTWYWYEQIDSLIVGRRLGESILGFLTVGKELAFMPVSKVVEVTSQVALPAFSRLQENPANVAESYSKAVRLCAIVGFPMLWGLAVTAPDLVNVALGSKWQPAVVVIQILAIAMPLRLAGSLAGAMLQGIGRPDLTFWYTLKTLVLSGILLVLGTNWGLVGVSIVWAISIPFGFWLGLRAVASCLPVNQARIVGEIAIAALPALVMTILVYCAQMALEESSSGIRLVASIMLGALGWLVAIFLIKSAYLQELREMASKFGGI